MGCPGAPEPLAQAQELFGTCSGHGACQPEGGGCLCDAGWTGRSDLLDAGGTDCQLSEEAVKWLWVGAITITVPLWLSTFPRVRVAFQRFRAAQARRRGSSLAVWRAHPMFVSIICFELVSVPCAFIYALVRLVRTDERVGVTPLATFSFVLTQIGFFIAVFFFQPFLLTVLLSASDSLKSLVPFNYAFSIFNLLVALAAMAFPLVTLFKDRAGLNHDAKRDFLAYLGLFAATLYIYATQASFILRRTEQLLPPRSVTSDRVRLLKKGIVRFQTQAILICTILGSVLVLFMVWPFLWTVHDYLTPFVWVGGTTVWRFMVSMVTQLDQFGSSSHPNPPQGSAFVVSSRPAPESTLAFENPTCSAFDTEGQCGSVEEKSNSDKHDAEAS